MDCEYGFSTEVAIKNKVKKKAIYIYVSRVVAQTRATCSINGLQ